MPTVGSLFSGIGGMDLGLERAGWTVRWQVEIDPFCRRVLAKHWPDVPRFADVRTLTGTELERVDLVAGGFPCQPVSQAGKRLAQGDPRWLWPEFLRIVRALRPTVVLVENVPGLLIRGIGDVLGNLAASGYDAEWDGVPAAAVGAPHLRWRLFIVGRRRPDSGLDVPDAKCRGWDGLHERHEAEPLAPHAGELRPTLADPHGRRCEELREPEPGRVEGPPGGELDGRRSGRWVFDAPGPGGSWPPEPDVGRVAHGVPARVDRLRSLGNAVVPQVVEVIGRRILEAEAEVAA